MLNLPGVDPLDVLSKGTYASFNVYANGKRDYQVTIALHGTAEMVDNGKVMNIWIIRVVEIMTNNVKIVQSSGYVAYPIGPEPHDIIDDIIQDRVLFSDDESKFRLIDRWVY